MKRLHSSTIRKALFGPPFLPGILVAIQILLIVTQAGTLLASQPPAYWLDARQTGPLSMLAFLLHRGPLAFAAVAFFYLILIGLLLSRLRFSIALPLFGILYFFHSQLLFWSMGCGWPPFLVIDNPGTCNTVGGIRFYAFLALSAAILLSLTRWSDKMPSITKWRLTRLFRGLAVGWLVFLGAGIVRAATPVSWGWKPLIPSHSPGERTDAAVAYDTKRARAILFGGVSRDAMGYVTYHTDTWEWNGSDWIQMKTPANPSPRVLQGMAYDEKRGLVVMYGGYYQGSYLSDVWEWDGSNWTLRCPSCNPAGRAEFQMFYDPVLGKVVIFGGSNSNTVFHEAWAWDGTAWGQLPFDNQVPAFSDDGLVYDKAHQQAIAFLNEPWGGTWIWKDRMWTKQSISPQPPRRPYFSLAYDPDRARTVLFGGLSGDTPLNDTWAYRNGAWIQIQSPLAPPARLGAVLFYDLVSKKMMLYGGERSGTTLADMWELDLP